LQLFSQGRRLLLPEVLVDGKKFKVIRKRQTYKDLIALEK
jgi:hypothetical protein